MKEGALHIKGDHKVVCLQGRRELTKIFVSCSPLDCEVSGRETSAASHFGGFEPSSEIETRDPLVLGRRMHLFASLVGGLESQIRHPSPAQTSELFWPDGMIVCR